jgi:hypothetical protein
MCYSGRKISNISLKKLSLVLKKTRARWGAPRPSTSVEIP